MKRVVIQTSRAPAPTSPASQAIRHGDLIFVGLQTGPEAPDDGSTRRAATEAHRALCNLQAILESAGSSLAGALRVTMILTDLADLDAVNAEYEHFFPADPPARTILTVDALPDGARVGFEAVAQAH